MPITTCTAHKCKVYFRPTKNAWNASKLSISHPINQHSEARSRDVRRDELGGGEAHPQALEERHHAVVTPAPSHEVHLPPETEPPHLHLYGPAEAQPGPGTGAPRSPQAELVQLADAIGEHSGVGRRARGDGGGVGRGGAALAEELRDGGLCLPDVVGGRGRGIRGRRCGVGEGGDGAAPAAAREGERTRVRFGVGLGGKWENVQRWDCRFPDGSMEEAESGGGGGHGHG